MLEHAWKILMLQDTRTFQRTNCVLLALWQKIEEVPHMVWMVRCPSQPKNR